MEKRIAYIDTAKGIGILLVIIGHHLMGGESFKVWINSFHMPMFFILTGIVAAKKSISDDMKTFLKKNVCSLLWPYATFSIINLLWYVLYYNKIGQFSMNDFTDYLVLTVVFVGYNALWFLPILFCAKVITRVAIVGNWKYRVTVVFVLISMVLAVVVKPLGVFRYKPLTYIYLLLWRIFIGTAFVLIGYILSKSIKEQFSGIRMIVYALLSLGLFQLKGEGVVFNLSWCSIQNPILYYLLALSGSLFVIELSKKIHSKALTALGKNSLIIMAIHMGYPGEMGWIIAGITRVTRLSNQTVVSLFVIAIEIVVCWISVVVINKHFSFLIKLPNNRRTKSMR